MTEKGNSMAAYVLGNVSIDNPVGYREYTSQVQATLDPFEGRFVVRAGAYETLEGEFEADRLVLIEFPTVEQARGWYDSEAYQSILPIRHANSSARFITLIEGVSN
jgi:uncharacterized protein (DUF1330 family)